MTIEALTSEGAAQRRAGDAPDAAHSSAPRKAGQPSCGHAIFGALTDHVFVWVCGVGVAVVAAIAASVATRVQLLPEVIDISIVPMGAGVGSLFMTFYGALRRFDPDRLGRVTVFGTLLGGGIATIVLLGAIFLDVLS
jgi:hypothetical protein